MSAAFTPADINVFSNITIFLHAYAIIKITYVPISAAFFMAAAAICCRF
jgi:hypothetical protein